MSARRESRDDTLLDVDDLCLMPHIDETSIVKTLQFRFLRSKFFTHVGRECVIFVNPFQSGVPLEPVIASLVERALFALSQNGGKQAILASGLRFSGKTSVLSSAIAKIATLSVVSPHAKLIQSAQTVTKFFTEVFMANGFKTTRAIVVSEFSFTEARELLGSRLRVSCLQNTCVAPSATNKTLPSGSFVALYAFSVVQPGAGLASPAPPETSPWLLHSPMSVSALLTEQADMLASLSKLGAEQDELNFVSSVCVAILHLSCLTFTEAAGRKESKTISVGPHASVVAIAQCLQITEAAVVELFSQQNGVALTEKAAADLRMTFACELYRSLTEWLFGRVNDWLRNAEAEFHTNAISVIDAPGLDATGGGDFLTLLSNFSSEYLTYMASECLIGMSDRDFVANVEGSSPLAKEPVSLEVLQIIGGPRGLLACVDIESLKDDGTEKGLQEELMNVHSPVLTNMGLAFTIKHTMTTVTYNTAHFRKDNITHVPLSVLLTMNQSKCPLVSGMSVILAGGVQGQKNVASLRSAQYRRAVFDIFNSLVKTTNYFVLCYPCNKTFTQREFDIAEVTFSISSGKVSSLCRVKQRKYVVRSSLKVFLERYGPATSGGDDTRSDQELMAACEAVLSSVPSIDFFVTPRRVYMTLLAEQRLRGPAMPSLSDVTRLSADAPFIQPYEYDPLPDIPAGANKEEIASHKATKRVRPGYDNMADIEELAKNLNVKAASAESPPSSLSKSQISKAEDSDDEEVPPIPAKPKSLTASLLSSVASDAAKDSDSDDEVPPVPGSSDVPPPISRAMKPASLSGVPMRTPSRSELKSDVSPLPPARKEGLSPHPPPRNDTAKKAEVDSDDAEADYEDFGENAGGDSVGSKPTLPPRGNARPMSRGLTLRDPFAVRRSRALVGLEYKSKVLLSSLEDKAREDRGRVPRHNLQLSDFHSHAQWLKAQSLPVASTPAHTPSKPSAVLPQNPHIQDAWRKAPWFHGSISRAEAEERLAEFPVSTFLIREKDTGSQASLSVKAPNGIRHFLIELKDPSAVHVFPAVKFDGLLKLLEHYKTNFLTEGAKLSIPCPKEEDDDDLSPHKPDYVEMVDDEINVSVMDYVHMKAKDKMQGGRGSSAAKLVLDERPESPTDLQPLRPKKISHTPKERPESVADESSGDHAREMIELEEKIQELQKAIEIETRIIGGAKKILTMPNTLKKDQKTIKKSIDESTEKLEGLKRQMQEYDDRMKVLKN